MYFLHIGGLSAHLVTHSWGALAPTPSPPPSFTMLILHSPVSLFSQNR